MTDPDRFDAFVRSYQNMVFGVAVRLLGDPAEAEDVAQTVFLRAFERFDRLEAGPRGAAWLRTVTTNLCLNHLSRFRARWRPFSDEHRGAGDGRTIEATVHGVATESPTAALERTESHVQLEQALRALPEHQRVPLVLFHFEDRSY